MAGLPIYCARCTQLAVVVVEAGYPGSGSYRAETACARHELAARRWTSPAGDVRCTPTAAPAQAALLDLPTVQEVTS